jgi:hypothetical protein
MPAPDAVALLHRLPHFDVALHDDIEDALVLVAELILAELAQAHPGLEHDLPGALLQLAAEHFHEGRLAAAVGADQAVTIAVGKFYGDLFEKRLCTELNRNIGSREHARPVK